MNSPILNYLYFSGSLGNFSVLQTDSFTHYVERTIHPFLYSDLLCGNIVFYLIHIGIKDYGMVVLHCPFCPYGQSFIRIEIFRQLNMDIGVIGCRYAKLPVKERQILL